MQIFASLFEIYILKALTLRRIFKVMFAPYKMGIYGKFVKNSSGVLSYGLGDPPEVPEGIRGRMWGKKLQDFRTVLLATEEHYAKPKRRS